MKKELIKEAFRLQQIAGIAPINEDGLQNELEQNSNLGPLGASMMLEIDKAIRKFAKAYMRVKGVEEEDVALYLVAQEVEQYIEDMFTGNFKKYGLKNKDSYPSLQEEQPQLDSGTSVKSILRDFKSVGINSGDHIVWEKAEGMGLTQHEGSAMELAEEIAEEASDDLEYEFFSSPEDLEYQEFEPGSSADGTTPVAAVQIEDFISYLIGKK